MKLTVLGSGSIVAQKTRYPSSYLLQTTQTTVLIDCGYLTIARLLEQGIDLQSIDAIALSHFHPDHFGHFLPIICSRNITDASLEREHKHLDVICPTSTEARFFHFRELVWPETNES